MFTFRYKLLKELTGSCFIGIIEWVNFAPLKVRDYHKKYYRPENTYITITGDVDEEEIFKSLEPLELKAVKRMAEYPPFVKPFQEVYGDIEKNIDKKIQFPSDEEEQGHVAFAWRLPYRLIDGVKIMQGVKILASYLTFTQVRQWPNRNIRKSNL